MKKTAAAALFILVVILLLGRHVFGAQEQGVSEAIGAHTPILKVEKNENPQNLMVVYTKVNPETCAFDTSKGKPVLDEYWLMDGSKYKPVHPMIKNAVRDRFVLDEKAYRSRGEFRVHLKDFHELKSDLGDEPTFRVTSAKGPKGCKTDVTMKLGPSDGGKEIAIESIYADSSKKVLPPFRKLNSLTLTGRDVATGAEIKKTYSAN